ncbi:MAG: dihydrodipicolinate reductase [Vicinamibacterales bacterium]
MVIRVVVIGLGPIGAAVARQLTVRNGFAVVGAVDIDPGKVGRDVGQVVELGRALRVKVTAGIGKTLKATKPDVALLCTGSSLAQVLPQFEEVLSHKVPIVTTTEEAAYPTPRNRRLARRLDEAARKAGVAVLGTGVNPGFTMDALPIALTAVCERVDSVEVWRVQDARIRRLPFQLKIGAGLTRDEFRRKVADGSVRHVGFAESIHMIGDAVGWKVENIAEEVKPRMAKARVAGELLSVAAGRVAGVIQTAVGYVGGRPLIRLRLEAYLGAPESYDSVRIEGSPRIHSTIAGGVHGDIATVAMAINSIPTVLAAPPGLRSMRDSLLPSFYRGVR